MFNTPAKKFVLTSTILLLLIVAAYFFFAGKAVAPAPGGETAATSTPETTPSTTTGTPALVTPDYKKPIIFAADISTDVRAQINAELAAVEAKLDANALDMKAWVDLGTLHKMGGDYAGAAAAWQFVLSVLPNNVNAAFNLGDLYLSYLHDTAKAESYFKQVIALQPTNVNAYANLYTMYHYTLKDDAKAAAILDAGLKANPGNNYLLGLQSELKSQ